MVIVLAEHQKGQVKKSALEAVTFGAQTAHAMGVSCAALVIGQVADAAQLGKYGASKVYVVEHPSLSVFDPQVYTAVIAAAFQQLGAKVLVLSHSANGRALLGRLAARLDAGSVSGVNAVPVFNTHLEVSKPVFSGKAVATYAIKTSTAVLSLTGNAVQPQVIGTEVPVEVLDLPVPAGKITVKSVNRQEGRVSLPEAELVVSAGRGMKGPENWGIIRPGGFAGSNYRVFQAGGRRRLAAPSRARRTNRPGDSPQPIYRSRHFRRYSAPGRCQ